MKSDVYRLIEGHYRKHARFLMKALSRSAGSRQNAEDAIQEAYANALQYWHTYDVEKAPLAVWFSPILQNAIKQVRRDESSRGIAAMSEPTEFEEFTTSLMEVGYDGGPFNSVMLAEIEGMISEEREDVACVLTLALVHQLPYTDIAKLVPQNTNNIQSLVYNFRKKLKAIYSDVKSPSKEAASA